jgi:Zn-dependent membrane protease YugP
MFYAFDPLWLLFALPGLLIGIWAQVKLSHAYGKYSRVAVESGMTGAAAALTYVAALVSSVLNLLYLLTIARDGRR